MSRHQLCIWKKVCGFVSCPPEDMTPRSQTALSGNRDNPVALLLLLWTPSLAARDYAGG
jgi:hypothetical protein